MRVLTVLVVIAVFTGSGCGGSSGRGVVPPTCTKVSAMSRLLSKLSASMLTLPAQPFGVAVSGAAAFVTLGGFTADPQLGVVSLAGPLRLLRTVALPVWGASGITVTPGGRSLLIAAGSGLVIVDAKAALTGRGRIVEHVLSSGGAQGSRRWSAIEPVVTADGRFAFVSLEYEGGIAVFDLRSDRLVGLVPVPPGNVGLALAPDGRRLYATGGAGAYPITPASRGSLTIIDTHRAETDPKRSVITSVAAGCDPVRVAVSPDGRSVWVSARGSNAVLKYDAGDLAHSPRKALRAVISTGAEPVGLTFVRGGRRLIVLDSDRFALPDATANLAVVDAPRAKLLAVIPSGAFPREAALGHGQLLVTDYGAFQLQGIDTRLLP